MIYTAKEIANAQDNSYIDMAETKLFFFKLVGSLNPMLAKINKKSCLHCI